MRDPRFRDRWQRGELSAGGVRLQKVLADAGLASRRAAELAIRDGRVRVNGRRVRSLPCLVDPGRDLVEIDGESVETPREGSGKPRDRVYLLLNKPRGIISTARDPAGRASVVDVVRPAVPEGARLYPVGRLDADSTGLVLLTNDGELAHRISHPRRGIAREYLVLVQGALSDQALARLGKGVFLADRKAPEKGARRARLAGLRVLKRNRDRRRGDLALLAVMLREGQNREIRRVFARMGVKVRRLERIAIGPLKLGDLPRGHFRRLRADEILALRRAVDLG